MDKLFPKKINLQHKKYIKVK